MPAPPASPSPPSRLTAVAAVGLGVLATLAAAAAVSAAPRAPDRLAAVFPPWWSPARAAAAAGAAGDISGAGAAPFILILRSDTPGLAARLRRAGAVLLLDPDAAGVCAPPVPETPS